MMDTFLGLLMLAVTALALGVLVALALWTLDWTIAWWRIQRQRVRDRRQRAATRTWNGIERRHSLSASLWLEGADGQPVTRTIPVRLGRSLAVATPLQRALHREGAMLKPAVLTMLLLAVAMPTASARAQEEPPRSGPFARIGLGLGNFSTPAWGWPG